MAIVREIPKRNGTEVFLGPCVAAVFPLLCLVGLTPALLSQTSVRAWGGQCLDSRAFDLPAVKVVAIDYATGVLRMDGRFFMQGQNGGRICDVPEPPPGRHYVDCTATVGLLDDGSVVQWGDPIIWTVPSLPAGMRYIRMSSTGTLLLRSDGELIGWGPNQYGQATLPALPTDAVFVDFEANGRNSGLLFSNGQLLVWGNNSYGQCNVPPLPNGLAYTGMSFGSYHSLALRSDGWIVEFGALGYPFLLGVPSLPSGLTYTMCAAGAGHSVALRSDGVLVAWGNNLYGQCNVPTLPPGTSCVQIVCGQLHTAVLLSNGQALTWGHAGFWQSGIPIPPPAIGTSAVRHADAAVGANNGVVVYSNGTAASWGTSWGTSVPPLPPGLGYLSARANIYHAAALRSDGSLIAWGSNQFGQLNIPSLPAGIHYVDFALGYGHSVAIRSDGQAVAVGDNTYAECTIPALPAGVTYVKVDADWTKTVLLRSDGQIAIAGGGFGSLGWQIPPLPAGLTYVAVAAGDLAIAAIRSDGSGLEWGLGVQPGWIQPVPPLPTGVSYVEVACGDNHVVWRRSDGQVVVSGQVLGGYEFLAAVRPLDPGTSYLGVSATYGHTIARVGPTTTYVSVAPGCAGSRPATRLIPRDTPRIGRDLMVTLFDLPFNIAMLAMGLQPAAPLSLATLGMPGCTWHTSLDAVGLLAGQNNQATWSLSIPDLPSLVGLQFYHQALVLDPAAGNSFGAVVSDVAQGVVGYP